LFSYVSSYNGLSTGKESSILVIVFYIKSNFAKNFEKRELRKKI